jgi:hypothetical protein
LRLRLRREKAREKNCFRYLTTNEHPTEHPEAVRKRRTVFPTESKYDTKMDYEKSRPGFALRFVLVARKNALFTPKLDFVT